MRTHQIRIGRVTRDLPVIDVGGVSVALLNLLGDTELVEAAAAELAEAMPAGIEALITPEVKAVPLAHALSRITGLPYVVVRKTEKPYMVDAVKRSVRSITTGRPQDLVLDGGDVPRLKGRRVAIVDDVVSTGGTLHGLHDLLAEVEAVVAATLVVFTEGEPRDDVVSLGHLPLYPAQDEPTSPGA
ncbi:MAG: phosphoribosyltransferase family protein [Trueperaceae bacterium]|nr:phosphoribosyltransferase family protein [Trueperaceae bacterium]